MPPGTGDVQLSVSQNIPIAGVYIAWLLQRFSVALEKSYFKTPVTNCFYFPFQHAEELFYQLCGVGNIFNMLTLVVLLSFKLSFEKMEKSAVTLEGKTALSKPDKFCSRKFPSLYLLHSKENEIRVIHTQFLRYSTSRLLVSIAKWEGL